MNHYLFSLTGDRQHMHGYLMYNGDYRFVENAMGRMIDLMNQENEVGGSFMPAILMTPLLRDIKIVHKIARKQNKDLAKVLSQATNFFFGAWTMPDDDPDDK